MKQVFLYLGLLLGSYAYAQTETLTVTGDFKTVQETFNVIDEDSGNFALFLQDHNQVVGTFFDKNNQKIAEVSAPGLSGKFESFIGYQIKGQQINLFMNTSNEKKYGRLKYDFAKGTSSSEELDFQLKGEKYINSSSREGQLHIVTIPKGGNVIHVYSFDESPKPELHVVDFGETDFYNENDKSEHLYDFMSNSAIFSSSVTAGEVEDGVPNAIETTSKHLKFYNVGNDIVLSMDKNPHFTYLIRINTNTFEKSVQRIEKPKLTKDKSTPNTNSFLNGGKLYQIVATSDAMAFQIIDLQDNNKVLKTLELTDDDPIDFKNTPIIQEGGAYDSYREMEKTSKFLRKIKNANIGISVYKENGVEQLTLGSAKVVQMGGGGAFMYGGAIGGITAGAISVSFNPMWTAYTGYTTSKSVHITGLFDQDYNHLEGEVPQNPFDRIKAFADDQKRITAETIFKKNGVFYWGAYFKKLDAYKVYKF